ncbi:MAG: ABC transporter permease [Actinobacteria bacterium]|nr:ABC transporter permease [Actinomycetota bacterium]
MLRLVLRGLATRKLRSALTAVAILLGVTMISGTFVLTDQIDRAFVQIFEQGNAQIDVVVKDRPPFEDQQTEVYLDADVVDRVRQVDGVALAEPFLQVQGYLVADGEQLVSQGGAPNFVFSSLPQAMNPYTPIAGRLPEASGEVAVAKEIAEQGGLEVGQAAQLATQAGAQDVSVVGILQFGDGTTSLGGSTSVIAPLGDVQAWWSLDGKASFVYAKSADGVSEDELADRVRTALDDPGLIVQTAAEDSAEQASELNALIGRLIRFALLGFAGVAVLVGAFIIFNTFSITVAQRTREFAMLRTIGASRRQILGTVVGEAFVIALAATLVGLVLGLGFAWGLNRVFELVGFGLPATGLRMPWQTVVVCLVVGIGVTVLAAIGPALRATRIAPVSALREGAVPPRGRLARLTPVIGVLIGVLGGAALVAGLTQDIATTQRLAILAAGAIAVFIGVAVLSRYIVRPVVHAAAPPITAVAGGVGRIAAENAGRNPARTAVTAAALMIGIGLVVFVTIFVGGLKESFTGAIDDSLESELIVTAQGFGSPLPAAVLPAVRAVEGVQVASPVGGTPVQIGQGTFALIGVDPADIDQVYSFDWESGDDALIGQLGADGAVVEANVASDLGVGVGDTVDVVSINGASATFAVRGLYADEQFLNGVTVTQEALKPLLQSNATGINTLFVKIAEGADATQVQAGVEAALAPFPTAQVQSNAEIKAQIESGVNQLLVIFYALLALSVIISLFGIVNTLVLSIFERTREIGMLRAVGTTRRQLRRMIRWESVITSIIGGVLGVLIGILFGWVTAQGLEAEGIVFILPVGTLLLFLALSIVAGVVAAILPARRAAKLDVLEALQYE